MKKTALMLMASAALAFTACTDDELINNGGSGKAFTITAEMPGAEQNTRTEIGTETGADGTTKMVALWNADDKVYAVKQNSGPFEHVVFDRSNGAVEGTTKTATFVNPNGLVNNSSYIFYYVNNLEGSLDKPMMTDFNDGNMVKCFLPVEYKINEYNPNTINNDLLISEEIVVSESSASVKFNRAVSIINLNIVKDASNEKLFENNPVIGVTITAGEDKGLSGVCNYNRTTKKVERCSGTISSINNVTYSFTTTPLEAGSSVHITMLPNTFVQGDKLTFSITTTSGVNLQKVYTVGAGGLDLSAGKVTKMNLKLGEEHIQQPAPDPTNDPTFDQATGVITMKQAGRLTSSMLKNWITADNWIKIRGDINTLDIMAIKKVLNGTEATGKADISLDLEEANIRVGGGMYQGMKDPNSASSPMEYHCVTKDNCLPKEFISHKETLVKDIYLPKSLTEIADYAIWPNDADNKAKNGRVIRVNDKVSKIGHAPFRMRWPVIYFYPKYDTLKNGMTSPFAGLYGGQCTAYFDKSWKQHMIDNDVCSTGVLYNTKFNNIRLFNSETGNFTLYIYNTSYPDVEEGCGSLQSIDYITPGMIIKAMKGYNGVFSLYAYMDEASWNAIKEVFNGSWPCSAQTIDLNLSGFCPIHRPGTEYTGKFRDSSGNLIEKPMQFTDYTLTEYMIDETDVKLGNLTMPFDFIYTIKSNFYHNLCTDHVKNVLFYRDETRQSEPDYTKVEGNIISGSNLHINVACDYKEAFKDMYFTGIGSNNKLYIHKTFKGKVNVEGRGFTVYYYNDLYEIDGNGLTPGGITPGGVVDLN